MPGTEATVEEDINETQTNVLRVPQLPSRAFLSQFIGQFLIFEQYLRLLPPLQTTLNQ